MSDILKRVVDNILFFLLLSLFLPAIHASGQNYPIGMYNGQTLSTCNGTFLDAGGQFAGYTFNEDYTLTFCSNDPQNTHIKLYFSTFNVHPSDTLYIFDGASVNAPLIGAFNNNNSPFLQPYLASINNSGGCLTVRFVSDQANNSSGWEAGVSCNTVCQDITAVFDSLNASHMPNDSGYIDICRQESITFSGYGDYPYNNMTYPQVDSTSLFVWQFSDGTSDTGMTVTHTFSKPIGYDVNLRITDDHGCMSTNSIGIRVRTSGNPLRKVNPIPEVCLGDTLELELGEEWNDHLIIRPIHHEQRASLKYDSLTFIPDGGATGGQCYTASVNFNLFDPNQTVLDSTDILAVRMNAEHSWVGDLKITLVCPTGKSVILKDYIQTGNAHFGQPNTNDCLLPWCVNQANMNPPGTGWTYTWSESANNGVMNNYVNNGQLDSVSYIPEQSFSDLSGCPLNGIWTLEVCDFWNHDNGYVFWWGLEINPQRIPESWQYTVGIDSMSITGNGLVSRHDSSLSISHKTAGDHPYSVTIWDEFGCTYDTGFTVTANPNPVADLPEDTLYCPGNPLPMLEAGDLGPGASYAWYANNTFLANGPSYQPQGPGQYELRLIDSNSCEGADTILVEQAAKPSWTVVTGDATCGEPNGNAEVIADSSLQVIWMESPTVAGHELYNTSPGWHSFIISDELCQYSDSAFVDHIPPPKYSVAFLEEENCGKENASAGLSISGGIPPYTTEWLTDPPQYGPVVTGLASGTVAFVVRDSLCTIKDSLWVDMIPGAKASFSYLPQVAELPDAIYRFRDESETGVVSWAWDFGDGMGSSMERNPVYQYSQADSFLVHLITSDTAGCPDTASTKLFVRDFLTFYVPNAFTPNADGLNDQFGPVGQNLEVEEYSMEIYDRWGRQVFYSSEMSQSWNGRIQNQGDAVPPGAYVYKILLKVRHRPLQLFKGTVTVY